jgi:hemerythrin
MPKTEEEMRWTEAGRVEWDASYETGITLIDDQHKTLFEYINGLLEAISDNGEDRLGRIANCFEKVGGYLH